MKKITELNQNFVLDSSAHEGLIDFDALFGRTAPLEIEIGSGKGTFLVSQAVAFPETNFLGFEWASKYYRHAADRITRRNLGNVRMLRDDAANFLREHVADGVVERFHIYFPDPWPKARHNKRRLLGEENMPEFYRTLAPGGVLNIATDHPDYFEQMEQVLLRGKMSHLFEQIDFTRPAGAREGEMTGTNFERKYLVEGRVTNTIALRKK